jgi:hypothetical protein
MHEYIINMHIHTRYSDGTGTHDQIAREAIDAGLDCIIITDHNVHVKGLESYVRQGGRKLIMLTGEEVHDQARQPQRNHLLVLGVDGEMAVYADQPQMLIDRVNQANGLSFIAHPIDLALPLFNEPEIPWDAWEVHNYTGIELWNGFSELKTIIRNGFDAVRYGLNFDAVAHSPHPAALHLWDDLTAQGLRVVAVGGSDAHRLIKKFGPFTRIIFPYRAHFQAVNTHILTADPLEWNNFSHDRKLIYQALQSGHCFIGYDLPASTRGFRFTVQTNDGIYSMGDQCELRGSVTLQIKLPLPTECRLIRDGRVIKIWKDQLVGAHITKEPGVYRVEAYIPFQGRLRGWIFSNPIYIRPPRPDRSFLTGPQWSQTTLPDF